VVDDHGLEPTGGRLSHQPLKLGPPVRVTSTGAQIDVLGNQ
jgi:hypothetical protein